MKFREKVVDELSQHLVRFGLNKCPVCDGEVLSISRLPVLLTVGGFPVEESDPRHDPDTNALFAAKVECDMCGHMLLFNVEQFHSGDDPILFTGDTEPPDPA